MDINLIERQHLIFKGILNIRQQLVRFSHNMSKAHYYTLYLVIHEQTCQKDHLCSVNRQTVVCEVIAPTLKLQTAVFTWFVCRYNNFKRVGRSNCKRWTEPGLHSPLFMKRDWYHMNILTSHLKKVSKKTTAVWVWINQSINQSNFICIAHIHKPQFVS